MRDKNYSFEKPENTYRIALLGGSYEMGSGVNNTEVYESLAEEKLNKNDTDSAIKHYEIMNFACGGFYLIQHVELAKTKVFHYRPDAVLYVAHTGESWRIILTLTNLIRQGVNLKYPLLEQLKKETGIKQSMSKTEIEDRLTPYTEKLIKWSYEQIALECYRHNAVPVWAFLPATTDSLDLREYNTIKQYADKLGFVILDLRGVYPDGDRKGLMISEWNTHPNPKGHLLIANKLYEEFIKNKQAILFRKK